MAKLFLVIFSCIQVFLKFFFLNNMVKYAENMMILYGLWIDDKSGR